MPLLQWLMRLVMDKKALLYPKWINQNTYCLLILSLKIKAKAKIKIILWNLEWHFLFLGIKLLPPYPPSHSRSPIVTFKNNAYLTSWHCHLHLQQKVVTSCLCVFFFFKLLLLTSGLVLRIWQIVLNSGYCSCYCLIFYLLSIILRSKKQVAFISIHPYYSKWEKEIELYESNAHKNHQWNVS